MSGDGVQIFDGRELIVKLDIQLKNDDYIENPSEMQLSRKLPTKDEMIRTGINRYGAEFLGHDEMEEVSKRSSTQRLLAKSPIARVLKQKKRDERETGKRMALLRETFEFMAYLQKKYDLNPVNPPSKMNGNVVVNSKQLGKTPYADVAGWDAISPSADLQACKIEDDRANQSKSSLTISASRDDCYSPLSGSTTTVPSCSSIVYEPQHPDSFKEVYRNTIRPQSSSSFDSLASSRTNLMMSWPSDSHESTHRIPQSLSSTGESASSNGTKSNSSGSSSMLVTRSSQYLSLSSGTTEGYVRIPIDMSSSHSLNYQKWSISPQSPAHSILPIPGKSGSASRNASIESSKKFPEGVYSFNFKRMSSQSSVSAPMTTSKSYPKVVYNYDNSAESKSTLSRFSRTSNELDISEARKMYEMVPCSFISNVSLLSIDSDEFFQMNLDGKTTQTTQTDSRSSTFPAAEEYMLVSRASSSISSPASKSKSLKFKAYGPLNLKFNSDKNCRMVDTSVRSGSQSSLNSSVSSSSVFKKAKMIMPKSISRITSSTESITESISKARTKDETPSDHSIEEMTQKTQSDSNKSINETNSSLPPTARSMIESKSISGASEVGVDALAILPSSLTVFAGRPTTLGLHNKSGKQMQISIDSPAALIVNPSDLALSGHHKAHVFVSAKSTQECFHTLKIHFKTANAVEKSVIDVQVVDGFFSVVPDFK